MAASTTPAMSIPEVHSIVPILAPAAAPSAPREQSPDFSASSSFERGGPMRAGQRSYLALATFIVGAAGLFVLPLPMGIAAIVMGWTALPRIQANSVAKGEGLAWTGLVVGVIDVGFWVLWMLTHLDDVAG